MSKPSEFLSIGEVAEKAGLRPSALRYYESIDLLPAPPRSSGRRRYDASVLTDFQMIQTAQKAGFSIEEIKTLLDRSITDKPYAERLRELARQKLVDVEKMISDAQAMKRILEAGLACRCECIDDCLLFINEEC